MADDPTRFFLGYGERLTESISVAGHGGGPEPAYSFNEAVERLAAMVRSVDDDLRALPELACPNDQAVGVVTLHPQWVAKSYHPQQLLSQYNLWQVGSRPVAIQPEKWSRTIQVQSAPSTELYVAGQRTAEKDRRS